LIEVVVSSETDEVLSEESVMDSFSLKLTVEYPIFGKKGVGCEIPTEYPEALPVAAEYAMATSALIPMNCALAVVPKPLSPKSKQAENASFRR